MADDVVEQSRHDLLNKIYDITSDLRNSLEQRSVPNVEQEDLIKVCQCIKALCVFVCTDGSIQAKEEAERQRDSYEKV